MPKVSEFFGIAIYFYYNDHNPPHFHARYADADAVFEIDTLRVLEGNPSPRVRGMIVEWASQRTAELHRAWQQARDSQPVAWIEPLS